MACCCVQTVQVLSVSDECDAESNDEDDEILLSSSDSEADSDSDEDDGDDGDNKAIVAEVKTEVMSETHGDADGDSMLADTANSDVIDIDKLASIIIKDDNDDDKDSEEHVSTPAHGSGLG